MMTPNKNHILSLPDTSTGLLLKACTTATQNQQTPHNQWNCRTSLHNNNLKITWEMTEKSQMASTTMTAQQLITACSRDLPKVYINLSFRMLNQFVAEFKVSCKAKTRKEDRPQLLKRKDKVCLSMSHTLKESSEVLCTLAFRLLVCFVHKSPCSAEKQWKKKNSAYKFAQEQMWSGCRWIKYACDIERWSLLTSVEDWEEAQDSIRIPKHVGAMGSEEATPRLLTFLR